MQREFIKGHSGSVNWFVLLEGHNRSLVVEHVCNEVERSVCNYNSASKCLAGDGKVWKVVLSLIFFNLEHKCCSPWSEAW